jgi:divalent metal cation (Fe/Co/Zn/Cd) transporter
MNELPMSRGSNFNGQVVPLERVGLYSIWVNVLLLGLNSLMAALSASLALIAEIVHNLADLLSAGAVFGGLSPLNENT